jgi:hypothetical protein
MLARSVVFVAESTATACATAFVVTGIFTLAPRLARQAERINATQVMLCWTRYECVLAACTEAIVALLSARVMANMYPRAFDGLGDFVSAVRRTSSMWATTNAPLGWRKPSVDVAPSTRALAGSQRAIWLTHRVVVSRVMNGIALVGSRMSGTSLRSPLGDLLWWLRDTAVVGVAAAGGFCIAERCGFQHADILAAETLQTILLTVCRFVEIRRQQNQPIPPFEFSASDADLDAMPPEQVNQLQEIATVVVQAQRVRHSARAPAATLLAAIAAFRQGESTRLTPEVEAVVVEATLPFVPSLLPSDEDGASCPICFDPFETAQSVAKLRCSHVFHEDCIRNWLLSRHVDCPFCRTDVRDPSFIARSAAERRSQRGGLVKEKLAEWAAGALPAYVELGQWHRAATFLKWRKAMQEGASRYVRADSSLGGQVRVFDMLLGRLLGTFGLLPPRFFNRSPFGPNSHAAAL